MILQNITRWPEKSFAKLSRCMLTLSYTKEGGQLNPLFNQKNITARCWSLGFRFKHSVNPWYMDWYLWVNGCICRIKTCYQEMRKILCVNLPTYLSIIAIHPEILLTLSLCGGGWWWIKVIFMSHPTFELRLSWGCDNTCVNLPRAYYCYISCTV